MMRDIQSLHCTVVNTVNLGPPNLTPHLGEGINPLHTNIHTQYT